MTTLLDCNLASLAFTTQGLRHEIRMKLGFHARTIGEQSLTTDNSPVLEPRLNEKLLVPFQAVSGSHCDGALLASVNNFWKIANKQCNVDDPHSAAGVMGCLRNNIDDVFKLIEPTADIEMLVFEYWSGVGARQAIEDKVDAILPTASGGADAESAFAKLTLLNSDEWYKFATSQAQASLNIIKGWVSALASAGQPTFAQGLTDEWLLRCKDRLQFFFTVEEQGKAQDGCAIKGETYRGRAAVEKASARFKTKMDAQEEILGGDLKFFSTYSWALDAEQKSSVACLLKHAQGFARAAGSHSSNSSSCSVEPKKKAIVAEDIWESTMQLCKRTEH